MKWLVSKRKQGLKQRNLRPKTEIVHNQKFDEATGQIYTEKTASIQSSDDGDWPWQTPMVAMSDIRDSVDYYEYLKAWEMGRSVENLGEYQSYLDALKNFRVIGFKGARTLQNSAIECILKNIEDITLEVIECLPRHIVRRVWHAVNQRCLSSFNTWKIFSKILYEGDTPTLGLFRYRQAIPIPKSPLHVYIGPLTSKSFDFITSLSITTPFPISDLVKLSGITNLGVLEIVDTTGACGRGSITERRFSGVGDRLIRDWHLAAANEGAFPVLRILKLWNHEELTGSSLPFLNSFPSLAVYDVRGCNFGLKAKAQAHVLGWRPTFDTNIQGLLEAACVERAVLLQDSLGIEARPLRKAHAEQLSDGDRVRRIPRIDVAGFLTRPEVALPVTSTHLYRMYHMTQGELDWHERQDPENVKKVRWSTLDTHLFRRSWEFETWEFTTYTSFNRIGELRNDGDLKRAGVDIGDQAIVGDELVNSVPLVSLRLGQTPSCMKPSPINSGHKPFYSSKFSEPNVSFKYDPEGTSTEEARSTSPSARTLSFIRIKAPEESASETASKSADYTMLRDRSVKEPGDGGSVKPRQAVPMKRHVSGVAKNKKRRLGDVLSSFL